MAPRAQGWIRFHLHQAALVRHGQCQDQTPPGRGSQVCPGKKPMRTWILDFSFFCVLFVLTNNKYLNNMLYFF